MPGRERVGYGQVVIPRSRCVVRLESMLHLLRMLSRSVQRLHTDVLFCLFLRRPHDCTYIRSPPQRPCNSPIWIPVVEPVRDDVQNLSAVPRFAHTYRRHQSTRKAGGVEDSCLFNPVQSELESGQWKLRMHGYRSFRQLSHPTLAVCLSH